MNQQRRAALLRDLQTFVERHAGWQDAGCRVWSALAESDAVAALADHRFRLSDVLDDAITRSIDPDSPQVCAAKGRG